MFALDAVDVRQLITDHPWAQLISSAANPGGDLVVSHLPILHDPDIDQPVVLGHLAAEDAQLHQLGRHRVVVVVQGPHGYISPTWYQDGPFVPTWNFAVAHLHGTPEVLDAAATFRILDATCERMESERDPSWQLSGVQEYADKISPYTTGFRLVPDRIVGKSKMSQDKPPEIVERVITAVQTDPVHGSATMAAEMRRMRDRGRASRG